MAISAFVPMTDKQPDSAQRPIRRIPRALLLPVGDLAQTMAEQIHTISRTWLDGEPPVVILAQPTQSGDSLPSVGAALDKLSSQDLMTDLVQRGLNLERNNEIHLWLLVHIFSDGDTDQSAERLAQNLKDLSEMAWQRLRVHTVPHALILAEPADQARLAQWVGVLAEPCEERIYVAGPVTHDHLRLSQEVWLARSATGVAALLWSAQPSHTHLARTLQAGKQIQALGAAAWLSPLPQLREYLSKAFARRVLTKLHGPDGPDTETSPHPAPATIEEYIGPEREVRNLSQTVPAPGSALRWGNRRPGFTALATVPDDLRREADRREKQRQMDLRRARQSWLAERLATWQEVLARRRQESLTPYQAWPDLGSYQAALRAQRTHALQAGEAVESQLERWGDQVAQAENNVDQAIHALQETCNLFPTPDLRGAISFLTHPWRIFGWAWAYLAWLPKQAQRVLDAQAQRAHLQWQDANWHVIRQFYLAQAQDLQLELAAVEKIRAVMTTTKDSLGTENPEQMAGISPWTLAGLAALGDHLFADDSVCAWGFLGKSPLSEWPHHTGEDLAARLLRWTVPWLVPLDGWTAADCVTEALPDSALVSWLSNLAVQASPLWPDQELQAESLGENRLLLPPVSIANQDTGQGERLQRLQSAAKAVGDVMQTVCHADALAWVRLAAVDLVLDLPEMIEEMDPVTT